MKKMIYMIVFTILLVSCHVAEYDYPVTSYEPVAHDTGEGSETSEPSPEITQTPRHPEENMPVFFKNDGEYEIKECVFQYKNVLISYPELSGISNQVQINALIKKLSIDRYKADWYDELDDLGFKSTYEVTLKNSRYLSVVLSGQGTRENSGKWSTILKTINLDLKTSKQLLLKDIIEIDDDFISSFVNGEFIPVNQLSREAMESRYRNFKEDIEYAKRIVSATDMVIVEPVYIGSSSYLTDTKLGIVSDAAQVLGGPAKVERTYSNLKMRICDTP